MLDQGILRATTSENDADRNERLNTVAIGMNLAKKIWEIKTLP